MEFAQFIVAEQADRAATRDELMAQHNDRQRELRETFERQKAEYQVKKVPACDGATGKSVRDWIREVEITIAYSLRTVFIAAQSAEGALRREIEHFLNTTPDKNQVTWPQLRQHLQNSFLSRHEMERLLDEVDNVKQSAYETLSAYGRRFRDTASSIMCARHRTNHGIRHC